MKNIFPVFLPPPEDFGSGRAESAMKHYSGHVNTVAGFSKDVAREEELFSPSGLVSPSQRKYDKMITRTERNDRYKTVKPLNFLNKPKYSAIERSSDYKTERRPENTNLIDASRFDYDVDNYDYIEEENVSYSNDFGDYEESFDDRIENRVDDFKLKRKYLDERLLSYLGLDKADQRNIRIHIPSKNGAKTLKKKPKKRIIIRRFKNNSARKSKKGSKRSKLKKTSRLTPAEELYLKLKSQLASPTRQTKLTARSISDNLEGESHSYSHSPHYHPQRLHDDHLAITREATRYSAGNYAEPKKVQFQIHGQGGPNSYRFGHDTGIG